MKKWLMAIVIVSVTAGAAKAQGTSWQIDPAHSNAQFVVRHLGISNVQGEFTKISGSAQIDDKDASKSSVSATIDIASVDTRVQGRDDDLKSANFFDVAKFPTMTFQSTKITKTGDGTAKMTGNLTIHGVTKEVTFDVVGPTAPINAMGVRRGVSATTTINRQDFGLVHGANKIASGDAMIGNEIKITLDVELTQK